MKKQILSFFIMNLKTKATCVFVCSLFLCILIAYIWKAIELDNYKKNIVEIGSLWKDSENHWIENLKFHSQIHYDFSNNKVLLQEKTGNKTSILIYRFSKYMCESCMQEDLADIERLQKEIGKDKVLLLPDFPDNREGMIELNNVLAKFNYVNLPDEVLLIPSQDGNYPQSYFAVIDKDGNLTMVFIPLRGKTNITQLYFSEVKKIIFD